MSNNKLLLAALATASMLSIAPLPAAADTTFYVDVAPPAARYEVIPEARHGYVWQPGYWDYRNGRHHWMKGSYIRERQGYYWHPTRWENENGRYHIVRGKWGRDKYAYRDSDRDGIPNSKDRDRDGDGVSNRNDRSPDNPNRR